jgi:integrase/recombinase XerD
MSKPLRPTALDEPIAAYLAHQRALGRGYLQVEHVLRHLRRFIACSCATDLDRLHFDRWCHTQRRLAANTLRGRQLIVHKFCRFRRRNDPTCFVPDPLYFARPLPYRSPVLVGPGQIGRMLSLTPNLAPSSNSPLRSAVLRLAIVLLYTAGLRRGELVRLTLADVDPQTGVLRIRESKFHKSRWVPLSVSGRRELSHYLDRRLAVHCGNKPTSPLLCNRSRGWRAYTGTGLSDGIHLLMEQAGVRDDAGRRPRIHDLRHSFAIQALIRWYRQGADVQTNLPLLALYMGHVSIVSTAYYLRLVPEVAVLASRRFEQTYGDVVLGGAP